VARSGRGARHLVNPFSRPLRISVQVPATSCVCKPHIRAAPHVCETEQLLSTAKMLPSGRNLPRARLESAEADSYAVNAPNSGVGARRCVTQGQPSLSPSL